MRRMPAEWEASDGVLLAWPDATTDWVEVLDEAQACVAAIAHASAQFARVLMISAEPEICHQRLSAIGCDMSSIEIVEMPVGDTWCREYGPLCIEEDAGYPVLLDFGFNGWGLKYPSADDNLASRRLATAGVFADTPLRSMPLILEGGSIESDGAGTILTTSACLLEANRNPHLSREQLTTQLGDILGAQRVLFLAHGQLAGDDTDGHIDTLARLCPHNTICYVACDDPEDSHFADLAAMQGN